MINFIKKYWWIFILFISVFFLIYFKMDLKLFNNLFKKSTLNIIDQKEKEVIKKIDKLKKENEVDQENINNLNKQIEFIKKEKENIKNKKFKDVEEAYKYILGVI
jgi:cell division protein FtsB